MQLVGDGDGDLRGVDLVARADEARDADEVAFPIGGVGRVTQGDVGDVIVTVDLAQVLEHRRRQIGEVPQEAQVARLRRERVERGMEARRVARGDGAPSISTRRRGVSAGSERGRNEVIVRHHNDALCQARFHGERIVSMLTILTNEPSRLAQASVSS